MIERLLVSSIVLAAAAYAIWSLAPAGARQRWALGLARSLGGSQAPGLRGRVAAVLQRAAAQPAGGCGSCPASSARSPARRPDAD